MLLGIHRDFPCHSLNDPLGQTLVISSGEWDCQVRASLKKKIYIYIYRCIDSLYTSYKVRFWPTPQYFRNKLSVLQQKFKVPPMITLPPTRPRRFHRAWWCLSSADPSPIKNPLSCVGFPESRKKPWTENSLAESIRNEKFIGCWLIF